MAAQDADNKTKDIFGDDDKVLMLDALKNPL